MEAAAAHLLDFSKPFDVELLDQICTISMDARHPQRSRASDFLVMLRDNPDMWKRADAILETSKLESSRYFALQVLSEMINTRWKIIPQEQRLGIRNYIVSKIIAMSSDADTINQKNAILSRLNLVLVEILKQDWPHAWPSFITDIVRSSKASESLCENNMRILKLLSEEVFDFSISSMTSVKIKTMKDSLNHEFSQIFQLCEFILSASTKESLLIATLQTLQRFLTWIPLGYIFETPLISVLINKFFPMNVLRKDVIDCLLEISLLPSNEIPPNYHVGMQNLLVNFVTQLTTLIPLQLVQFNIDNDDELIFLQRLSLFLSTYLRNFFYLFHVPDGSLVHQDIILTILYYMIKISEVEDEEVFKTCLEFWHYFSKELHTGLTNFNSNSTANSNTLMPFLHDGHGPSTFKFGISTTTYLEVHNEGSIHKRLVILNEVLHMLRIVIIDHMAKPEEVLIVEDDNGEIVREMTKDTEVIAQYKTMRDTIVYLTHLNYEDTEAIMLEKLELQVTGGMFSWNGLNTLCWAIGSISMTMSETDEKRFLVSVIKDLLRLCEEQRGKENKAVVASNIMYIVGQYPRFLRNHWKFLKTVVNKLFEFMHEYHPGVQDMACDTFLKIAQKCKRKFMTSQIEDPTPYIVTLISDLSKHISDLQPHQVLSFYESVGTMISDQGAQIRLPRESLIVSLMESTNISWIHVMNESAKDVNYLLQVDSIREISRIIRINNRVCYSAGAIFVHQLSNIFMDVLKVYQLFTVQIKEAISTQGAIAIRLVLYKAMKHCKADILDMFISFFNVCKDIEGGPESIMPVILPPLLNEILLDYNTSPAPARDAKILSLLSVIITVFKDYIQNEIPRILDAIFQSTLEMITVNMLDHPEHRIAFFQFLRSANQYCFYGLFNIPITQQKLLIDSIVWAFKHTERNISETGLEILEELLHNITNTPQIAQSFYQHFLLSLIQDIMVIMTDRLHKSGFKLQASILMHIFHQVQGGHIIAPLNDNYTDNALFLKEHVANLLINAFPNLTKTQVITFVMGLFDEIKDLTAFKQHLRDFLITIKEFSSEDNSDLYAEEAAIQRELEQRETHLYRSTVPGLLKADEINDNESDVVDD